MGEPTVPVSPAYRSVKRRVDTMQSANKSSVALVAMLSMPGPQGWENLPVELLQSIVALLSSTRDLFAFAATCPAWGDAFTSVKSAMLELFPPLIIRHRAQLQAADPNTQYSWEIIDYSDPNTTLHRVNPPSILYEMEFVGCFFGHAMFYSHGSYAIADVFTGTIVSVPHCPSPDHNYFHSATLTAPPSSPNSYLLVCTPNSLLAWKVGSSSWLQLRYPRGAYRIKQIVVFRGQVFAWNHKRLFTVTFESKFRMRRLQTVWNNKKAPPELCAAPWLVVCDDMLVLLGCLKAAFSLDLSAEPANFVSIGDDHLSKWAFFISQEDHSQQLSFKHPERRGLSGRNVYGLDSNAQVCTNASECSFEICSFEHMFSQDRLQIIPYKYTDFAAWI